MDRLAKILTNQLNEFYNDPHPNLWVYVDNNNIKIWYFLITGLENPYKSGEYLFKLTAKDDYPMSPPKFEFLTQNGLFQIGMSLCISIGEFHTNDDPGSEGSYGWRPSLGMVGFAINVVNALICFKDIDHGIGIIKTPDSMKSIYAKLSRSENIKNHSIILALIENMMNNKNQERLNYLLHGRGDQNKVDDAKVDDAKVDDAKVDDAKVDDAKVDNVKFLDITDDDLLDLLNATY